MEPPSARFALIDGDFVEYAQARVHVEDRGFQFGESVYEVLSFHNGTAFRLKAHLARLNRSATAIGIDPPSEGKLADDIRRALVECAGSEGMIYIQATGGWAVRDHAAAPSKTTVVMLIQLGLPDRTKVLQSGLTCMTVPDDRWARCHIKSTFLLPNILARRAAFAAGYQDAIFVRDGYLTEGTSSNVFLVIDDALVTPPATNYILRGITRDAVLELSHGLGAIVREEPIHSRAIETASEAFLTSTVLNIRPISAIDGHILSTGGVGLLTKAILGAFEGLVQAETAAPHQ